MDWGHFEMSDWLTRQSGSTAGMPSTEMAPLREVGVPVLKNPIQSDTDPQISFCMTGEKLSHPGEGKVPIEENICS